MTIVAPDFRHYVVQPALAVLAPAGIPHSLVAEDLLIATAANESALGTYLVQQNSGPALGVFQIEPTSLENLYWQLSTRQRIALKGISTAQSIITQIPANLVLAAAVCRLFYWQVPLPLPAHTVAGLWSYYKMWYNTMKGAATEPEFVAALKLTDIVF